MNAIIRLGEKAHGSGGKSEDQPLSEECQTTLDVRARGDKYVFFLSVASLGSTQILRVRVLLYKFKGETLS